MIFEKCLPSSIASRSSRDGCRTWKKMALTLVGFHFIPSSFPAATTRVHTTSSPRTLVRTVLERWNCDRNLSDDTVLLRYSVNQGEDIWTQLLFGMRYLDLRVGMILSIWVFGDMEPQVSYYEDTPEKFWLVHDFVKQNPLWASHRLARF